jgi:hypothetical protein
MTQRQRSILRPEGTRERAGIHPVSDHGVRRSAHLAVSLAPVEAKPHGQRGTAGLTDATVYEETPTMSHPILLVIARLPFRVAKTMPHIPHEYTVRNEPGSRYEDFVALWTAIHTDGVRGAYKGRSGRYLYPGDGWKYWYMSSLRASWVLNRMLIRDDLAHIIAEGRFTVEVEMLVEQGYLTQPEGETIRATAARRRRRR